jgi:hypothetical protein
MAEEDLLLRIRSRNEAIGELRRLSAEIQSINNRLVTD